MAENNEKSENELIIDFGAGEAASVAQKLAELNPKARIIAFEKGGFFRGPQAKNLLEVTTNFSEKSSLPLPDSSVDRVFATFVWADMPGEKGYGRLLKEFHRVLKKGGKAFLCETWRTTMETRKIASNIGFTIEQEVSDVYPEGSHWGAMAKGSGPINEPTVLILSR